jgi:cob(I)alamin adenosyltransferase
VLAIDDAPPRPLLVVYLNRLSDLLFVLARVANREKAVVDVPWSPHPRARS